jgi:hypothetical protein
VLAGKNFEAEPGGRGNPAILLVSNDLEQLRCAVAPESQAASLLPGPVCDLVQQRLTSASLKISTLPSGPNLRMDRLFS